MRVRLPSPSMARPAFGGLGMGIHAHLYDAGRPGLSLPLCGVCTTRSTRRIGNSNSNSTAKAGMPLRETVYQERACKMQLTPRLSGPTVPVALSAQAPRPLRGAKTRINHARPVKLADRSTGRVCARGSIDQVKRISEARYQCGGSAKAPYLSWKGLSGLHNAFKSLSLPMGHLWYSTSRRRPDSRIPRIGEPAELGKNRTLSLRRYVHFLFHCSPKPGLGVAARV